MKTDEFYRKWSANCRIFKDYNPIHSHEDMMDFAQQYANEQTKLKDQRIKELEDENKRMSNACENIAKTRGYYEAILQNVLSQIDTDKLSDFVKKQLDDIYTPSSNRP